ncbi:MAG TPA: translesion error-prone DNA polymerase V autoproteolytic subunit [Flavisolibacter sp.]|nr:translesion error-prone DNA polymerase V autoproteolytic subunit [Flavisolibacter sp.]
MDAIFYPLFRQPEQNGNPEERGVDLNEQLVRNRPATFVMRVNSNAMQGAGIHRGDVVIVDRSIEALNGKVIIALLDGEMLIRRLDISGGKRRLLPATDRLGPIDISEGSSFQVWGVVTYVIHSV